MAIALTVASVGLTAAQRTDAARDALLPATRALLDRALGQPGPAQLDAMKALGDQPDWQAVVDLTMTAIAATPGESHNDHALIVEHIARQRIDEIRIDIAPLLRLLETRSWTNQQKAAQALAVLADRRDLFEGREGEAAGALVPLTTSQRGRVVDAALEGLERLTGRTFGRDPRAWAAWLEATWGARVNLTGAVYEVLAVIRRREGTNGLEFSLNGGPWSSAEALVAPYQALQRRAADAGISLGTVIIVPEIAFDESTLLAQVDPLRPLFRVVQPKELTFSPESDVFYPPLESAMPVTPNPRTGR